MPIDVGGKILYDVATREYEYRSIPSAGLLLHLDARIFDTISGNTWYDFTGRGHHHTVSGFGDTTVDGVKCIDCTGSNGVRDAGTTFTFGNDHTMIAWAYTSSDAQVSSWRTLWRTTPYDHPLLIEDGTDLIGYYDNENATGFNSYGLTAAGTGIANTWSMLTLVGTGGTSTTLYINEGTTNATVSRNPAGNNHDMIGTHSGYNQAYGYVAAAYIYDRALTTTEISNIYNITKHRYGY